MSEPELVHEAVQEPPPASQYHWYHKVSAVLFIIFCLELGLFLLVFPWTDKWEENLFALFLSSKGSNWLQYWQNAYFRGAVSGLGVANLYISFSEIFRLRRFSRG